MWFTHHAHALAPGVPTEPVDVAPWGSQPQTDYTIFEHDRDCWAEFRRSHQKRKGDENHCQVNKNFSGIWHMVLTKWHLDSYALDLYIYIYPCRAQENTSPKTEPLALWETETSWANLRVPAAVKAY